MQRSEIRGTTLPIILNQLIPCFRVDRIVQDFISFHPGYTVL